MNAIRSLLGHVPTMQAGFATLLAGFAAATGFTAVRFGDSPRCTGPRRRKASAFAAAVALGLLALVIWLTVLTESGNQHRAAISIVSTISAGKQTYVAI